MYFIISPDRQEFKSRTARVVNKFLADHQVPVLFDFISIGGWEISQEPAHQLKEVEEIEN